MNFSKLLILATLLVNLVQPIYADTSPKDASMQNEILAHINKYRQQHGLTQFKLDSRISNEARNHSVNMATHRLPFGHEHFLSRIDRLHSQIQNSGAGAENVAYNYKDAQTVVSGWLKSPGHKQNIDGNYNLTGIGIARDQKGKLYFTQIFLRTNESVKYARRRNAPQIFVSPFLRRST